MTHPTTSQSGQFPQLTLSMNEESSNGRNTDGGGQSAQQVTVMSETLIQLQERLPLRGGQDSRTMGLPLHDMKVCTFPE